MIASSAASRAVRATPAPLAKTTVGDTSSSNRPEVNTPGKVGATWYSAKAAPASRI